MLSRKLFTVIVFATLISSCTMVPTYEPPVGLETSRVLVTRDVKDPILGSTTHIYKLNSVRECGSSIELDAKHDVRLMILDKGNPLVTELNADGVDVISNVPLFMGLMTLAGPQYRCNVVLGFTPKSGYDYEIKLLGRVDIRPHQCSAELWRSRSGSDTMQKQIFDSYDECK